MSACDSTPEHSPRPEAPRTAAEAASIERTALACGRLLGVLKRLRAPDGCPWDREQTAESLKPYMLEECHEVMCAIDGGNARELREELGDLLLHALFQAEIAEEGGRFGAAEPFEQITEKLIRRHPHVFGGATLESSAQVERQWETLKLKEKGSDGTRRSLLDGVPRTLPGLLRAQRIQEKMAGVGFDWTNVSGARQKLEEEYGELCRALDHGDREEAGREFGDLLFSLVNVARFLGIHPEDALRRTNEKVTRRFGHVERRLAEAGLDAGQSDLATMDRYWDEAKRIERGESPAPDTPPVQE